MQEGRDSGRRRQVRAANANDNGGPEARIGDAVLCLSRLLGRKPPTTTRRKERRPH